MEIVPTDPVAKPVVSRKRISQVFKEGDLRFAVSVRLSDHSWFRKRVDICGGRTFPTPDFVEVDRQGLPADSIRICGYRATSVKSGAKGEEEGAGIMPGCGYPLIGRHFFAGLEHPAAFNHLKRRKGREHIRLLHHPTWQGNRLEQVDEVFGWAEDARAAFSEYLDTIRLPVLADPLVSFCTFWSDPYLDNLEYRTSYDAYRAYFRAFMRLGLRPDVFTLDAGWNDRDSVLQAKKEVGRDAGLVRLRKLAEKSGSALSLWVSNNGPVGIAPEFMKKQGYEVGGGNGAAYCGDGYGVMLDERLAGGLEERFIELAGKVGVKHFKIDWDNECATNAKFAKTYPTRNHVRQATLNAFFRITRRIRELNPGIATRGGNGWPSPWWLSRTTHIWIPDGGDSEFASLPSKTQRDAATTHRDLMYYYTFQRDGSAVPLDCFDNHEFPDAPRNPFAEDRVSWTNATWLSFMRGTTYLTYKLMPESMESWQVEAMKEIMAFCRMHSRHICVSHGRMVFGNPGRGEIYGYVQPGKKESWCVLRNPLPLPQEIRFSPRDLSSHTVRTVWQFYPFYEVLRPRRGITMTAHEVRVLILSAKRRTLPYSLPFMAIKDGSSCRCVFPASAQVTEEVRPMVHPIHRIRGLRCLDAKRRAIKGGKEYRWFLETPYRMRGMEFQMRIKAKDRKNIKVSAFFSRFRDSHCTYAFPVTVVPVGDPGHGERKNLDRSFPHGATYFAVRVPDGGEFSLTVSVRGMPKRGASVEAWLAGYEAPSREAICRERGPGRFAECLPHQHPLGFGKTLRLPVP